MNYNSLNCAESRSLHSVQSDEFLPPVSQWLKLSGWGLLGVFVTLLTLAAVVTYPQKVRAKAEVRPQGELRLVDSALEGTVNRIAVHERDFVQKDELIAVIDDASLQSRKNQLLATIESAKQQLTLIAEQRAAVDIQNQARANSLYQELETAKTILKNFEYARGAIAENEIRKQQQTVQSLVAQLQQIQANGVQMKAELNQKYREIETQMKQQKIELQETETKLRKTIIRAPVEGAIHELNLRNQGQTIRPGDIIARIVPKSDPLIIEANIAASQISKVAKCPEKINFEDCRAGKVILRFDGYPYSEYGTLLGFVRDISPDKIAIQEEEFFKVIIEPEKLYLKNPQNAIRSGFTAEADVIIKEDTLLKFVFRQVSNWAQ